MLWRRVVKHALWKADDQWKIGGWRLAFGRQCGDEYFFRGMMWADNCWLLGNEKRMWVCMVNDIIKELLELDVEPKPESLWWRSTNKEEDVTLSKVGSRG